MKKAILLLILFLSLSYSAFIEELEVLVVDNNLRIIEGAAVWANYQINNIRGYVTTNPQYTNSRGKVNLKLINNEYTEQYTKHEYTLFIEYMGKQQQHTIDARSPIASRTFYVDVNQVSIRVFDIYEGGVDANVTVLNQTKPTGKNGFTYFNLPNGNYEAIIEYGGSILTIPFTLEGDEFIEVPLTEYTLNIKLVDDKGNLLEGDVLVQGEKYKTFSKEIQVNTTGIPPLIIKGVYEDKETILEIDPKLNTNIIVPIDIHPPEITNTRYSRTERGYEITVSISDTGPYASGIDKNINPPFIKYSITKQQEKLPERTLNLLLSQHSTYTITLTDVETNSVVDFEIWASDLSGNIISHSESFVATSTQSEPKPEVPSLPQPEEELKMDEIFKWVLIVLGVIVVILIIYAVFKLKKEIRTGKEG